MNLSAVKRLFSAVYNVVEIPFTSPLCESILDNAANQRAGLCCFYIDMMTDLSDI